MKQNGILYDTEVINGKLRLAEEIGDQHLMTTIETPMKANAFDQTDDEKIAAIAHHFTAIMDTLGLDLTDDSLSGTPLRVAKMYVKEVFSGLNPANMPDLKMFENKYRYAEMLVEKNINLHSFCEHHFVPILGKAHIAYVSSGKVVGLSKLNRLVRHFAKRPQVQERLTIQIGEELKKALGTEDVAVIIDAAHMCVSMRGIEDTESSTITAFYSGCFKEEAKKAEFHRYLDLG